MAYVKTNWQDGVEGNTKIDASKLNNIENGIVTNENNINSVNSDLNTFIESLYFKDGDTYKYTVDLYCGSALTGSKQSVMFTIPLPKMAQNLETTVESGTVYIRSSTGSLINGQSILDATNITTHTSLNYVTIELTYPAFSSQMNNICLSVALRNLEISFSTAS